MPKNLRGRFELPAPRPPFNGQPRTVIVPAVGENPNRNGATGDLDALPFHLDPRPYCTRGEAAAYLCWKDCDSLDPHLIDSERPTDGKIRFKRLTVGSRQKVVCVRADVLRLLPAPLED